MSQDELSQFESRLRDARPAPVPQALEQRLIEASQQRHGRGAPRQVAGNHLDWATLLRWLVPATSLVLAAGLLWLSHASRPGGSRVQTSAANGARLKADEIQIDQELISAVDAIARLPEGEPVRFQYREWLDDVILRDKASGVIIHQRTPRVEVVPVGFETY